jgi:hypothetical protein
VISAQAAAVDTGIRMNRVMESLAAKVMPAELLSLFVLPTLSIGARL